jgi:hypothetical protein
MYLLVFCLITSKEEESNPCMHGPKPAPCNNEKGRLIAHNISVDVFSSDIYDKD